MIRTTRAALAAAAALSTLTLAPAAFSQQAQPTTTVQGGTSGSVTGRNVSAGTYGEGYKTTSPDGQSIGVAGGGEATAVDGTATTRTDAKFNDQRAMQKSTAKARTDDERARSRSRTMVGPNDVVRSRTTTMYKQKGEKPVRETTTTVVRPDGTTTTRNK